MLSFFNLKKQIMLLEVDHDISSFNQAKQDKRRYIRQALLLILASD